MDALYSAVALKLRRGIVSLLCAGIDRGFPD